MRSFLTLVVLGLLGYGVYWYWGNSGSGPETSAAPDTTSHNPGNGAARASQGAVEPPPAATEEDAIRERIAQTGNPEDADRHRYDLARLLLAKTDNPDAEREAVGVLRSVFENRGDFAVPAAAILQANGNPEEQIQFASFIRAQYLENRGPSAAAYADACVVLGRASLQKPEESEKVTAWEILSEAYFARDISEWRDSLRVELDELVNRLVFSRRPSRAFISYTVQPGDYLAKIAKHHGTTVEALRWLNQLEGDTIHPGKRLKILTGTVTLEVKKSAFRLDARLDGKYLFSAPVGLGKEGTTPLGEFVIDVKQVNPSWQKVGQPVIPHDDPRNPLGDRWLGFKNTPEHHGYGIHGTREPATVGTESSEGCIRMTNEDVVFLYRIVPIGTRVELRE